MTYLKNITTIAVDAEKCTGCGRCLEVCPQGVLARDGKKVAVAERDACIECGACMRNCPYYAVTVEAGVGCAAAFINGALSGGEPNCGCGGGSCCG